jgi:hypothetical protein
MSAQMPGMLSRDQAGTLYAQLQARADRKRARRGALRRGGAVSVFLALVAAVVIVVMFPRGEPVAYAFSKCGTSDPSQNLHPLLSQLTGVPAIAIVAAADGQPIQPKQVTATCAHDGGGTAAIRVTALIAGRRVAVETWYVNPQLKPIAQAGSLRIASGATASPVMSVHHAPAYRAADGSVFVRTPTPGVNAIVVRSAGHERVLGGIVVGFANRNHTGLAAAYDATLAPQAKSAPPTSRAGGKGFSTRTYAVQNVGQIVDHLTAEGFDRAAILPGLRTVKLEIVDTPRTRIAKTTYENDEGQQVRVAQISTPYLPETGKAVAVRGTTGKLQSGSDVYWDENGWLLIVSTSRGGHPAHLAGEVQWRSP